MQVTGAVAPETEALAAEATGPVTPEAAGLEGTGPVTLEAADLEATGAVTPGIGAVAVAVGAVDVDRGTGAAINNGAATPGAPGALHQLLLTEQMLLTVPLPLRRPVLVTVQQQMLQQRRLVLVTVQQQMLQQRRLVLVTVQQHMVQQRVTVQHQMVQQKTRPPQQILLQLQVGLQLLRPLRPRQQAMHPPGGASCVWRPTRPR